MDVKNSGRGAGVAFHQTTISAVLLARRRAARDSLRSCLALGRRFAAGVMLIPLDRAVVMLPPGC